MLESQSAIQWVARGAPICPVYIDTSGALRGTEGFYSWLVAAIQQQLCRIFAVPASGRGEVVM
jgi:hypothetical protein